MIKTGMTEKLLFAGEGRTAASSGATFDVPNLANNEPFPTSPAAAGD